MKRIFFIVLFLLGSMNASAVTYVIHDIDESSVRSLTFLLSKLVPSNTLLTPIRHDVFEQYESSLKADDIVVTIGVDRFRQACGFDFDGAVMALFIGREEYRHVLPDCPMPTTGVFSGAPLAKNLALLETIWLDQKPLALLYSDNVLIDENEMTALAAEYGFEFQFLQTQTDRLSVLRSVNIVLERSGLIFSVVDTELYKNGNAQAMLKQLFNQQQLMIGPAFSFVRAGSLFAVYSDTQAKLEALAERIRRWQTEKHMLDAIYPEKLRVSFNPSLIKAHGVVPPSASFLNDRYGLCAETLCD
ncbi:hypothetical protein [Marinomonas profundi]|uniref:hypothetical protein n=1 Tax=Marinomonas profundi TaxID=2726122 RepID=UPI001D0F5158|nr:hypothetical protein [Marinomonas profundi]